MAKGKGGSAFDSIVDDANDSDSSEPPSKAEGSDGGSENGEEEQVKNPEQSTANTGGDQGGGPSSEDTEGSVDGLQSDRTNGHGETGTVALNGESDGSEQPDWMTTRPNFHTEQQAVYVSPAAWTEFESLRIDVFGDIWESHGIKVEQKEIDQAIFQLLQEELNPEIVATQIVENRREVNAPPSSQ